MDLFGRAVTSTLHQRLKFLINNKWVVVEGEEDIMVSHLSSFRCIEGEGEWKEIPFKSFEIVNIEMVFPKRNELKNVEFPMASLKDALTVIKSGHPVGWGRMLELPNNNDRTGLGYNTQSLKKTIPIVEKGQVFPLSDYFSSVGHLVYEHICAL